MTYEIFAEEICRGVKEALNETHTVKLMNTMKLNDTRKVQLLIEKTHPEEGIYAEPSMMYAFRRFCGSIRKRKRGRKQNHGTRRFIYGSRQSREYIQSFYVKARIKNSYKI